MANPSQPFSWKLYGGKKPCPHCGLPLKKEEPGGLWITEFPGPVRVAHFRCELEALQGTLTPAPPMEGQITLPV